MYEPFSTRDHLERTASIEDALPKLMRVFNRSYFNLPSITLIPRLHLWPLSLQSSRVSPYRNVLATIKNSLCARRNLAKCLHRHVFHPEELRNPCRPRLQTTCSLIRPRWDVCKCISMCEPIAIRRAAFKYVRE